MEQEEYKFHVVHLVERITDGAVYIDKIDGEDKEMRYLFEYLNKKGKDGWRYSHESRHEPVIYLQKKAGEQIRYEYQVVHCIEEHTDGPMLVQRVNEHKLVKRKLLSVYLNEMGEKGFYLRGELRHQFCNIIERKR
jgi:hypothetical protein